MIMCIFIAPKTAVFYHKTFGDHEAAELVFDEAAYQMASRYLRQIRPNAPNVCQGKHKEEIT